MSQTDKLYAWIEVNLPDLHQKLSAASPARRVSILEHETRAVIGDDENLQVCAETILALLQMKASVIHLIGTRHDAKKYGCHNRAPLNTVCAPTCQYTHTVIGQADERCVGCRERLQVQVVEHQDKPDIIRLARESGAPDWWIGIGMQGEQTGSALAWLGRFASLVIADFLQRTGQYVTNEASRDAAIAEAVRAERKAIKKLAQDLSDAVAPCDDSGPSIVDAISARGAP